jgi:precorrin-8X/cobalt-precorrin-8 methylmutase
MTMVKPEAILAESFRIIEREIGPHSFTAEEWPIVRRMIHASGDLELAPLVRFHNDPVVAGLAALAQRRPIVTDVTMVRAGIQQRLAERLAVPLHCLLNDPGVEQEAKERGITRCACGLERALERFPDAIYAIGNAPTALLALCAATRAKRVQPALIVAMPVGFVAVAESKEDALLLPVPVISVAGRKGGSALAAAAVNALLLFASEGKP